MRIGIQRALDKWVGIPLCACLSLIDKLRPARPDTGPPRRILVVLLSEMGSLVLAYPMLAWLKERYPDAQLHMLMFEKNREAIDLMGIIPPENVLTLDDRELKPFAQQSLAMIGRMRALQFDAVIDCELFARISSIFSYLSNARLRAGFHPQTQEGLYRGSFINRPVIYNPYRHLTLQLLTLATSLESPGRPLAKYPLVPPRLAKPRVDFSDAELAETRDQLYADFPGVRGKRLVLVYPGGGILPIRAWPPEYYSSLCTKLVAAGFAVAVIGLKEDTPLAKRLVAACDDPACIDLTGYTKRVRDLLRLFHLASLLVSNDGAPGQFAALTSLPAIVFFGPETPALYGPLASNVHTLHRPIGCSPCLTAYNHRNSPCDGDNQCLKTIGVEEVLAKARELLDAPAPSSATEAATA